MAFDTSVIVAALVENHPHHKRSLWWFGDGPDVERIASWHAYAESWAVLTAMPLEPRVSGEAARAVLERLRRSLKLTPPRPTIYASAVARCASRGLRSGAIYDALHLLTAEHATANLFLTFNVKDFERLSEPDSPPIRVPPDPPRLP